jgi:hypothetical protein
MTPWINSGAFKSITLKLITRGFHGREIIFNNQTDLGSLITLLVHKPRAPFLVFTQRSANSERRRIHSNDLHGKEELKPEQRTSRIQ